MEFRLRQRGSRYNREYPKGIYMKKNLLHASLSFFMLIVFLTSVSAEWIKTSWPANNVFFNLYISQKKIFARTWDALNGGRMFFSTDNGETWTQIGSADSTIDILSLVIVNNNILVGTWEGFYRSGLSPISWNAVTPTGIPADTAILSIAMINNTLLAGTKGALYKSSDSSTTWTEVKSGIPENARITSIVGIGNAIFAGSDSSGVFISTTNATSWTAINSGLTDRRISQLAAMGTKLFAVTLSNVFVSGNNGASWAANSSNLKNINCLVNVNNQLFAGTDSSAVFRSVDSGVTWTPFGSGMPASTRVWSLAASSDNFFAGTNSGVWRNPFSITPINKSGTTHLTRSRLQFSMQNGSRATLLFTLVSPQTVDFDLYDLCGRKIAKVVHKNLSAGMQCVSFTTGSIAAGSYIIRLMAGTSVYYQIVSVQR
jgi:hypothetical protein